MNKSATPLQKSPNAEAGKVMLNTQQNFQD